MEEEARIRPPSTGALDDDMADVRQAAATVAAEVRDIWQSDGEVAWTVTSALSTRIQSLVDAQVGRLTWTAKAPSNTTFRRRRRRARIAGVLFLVGTVGGTSFNVAADQVSTYSPEGQRLGGIAGVLILVTAVAALVWIALRAAQWLAAAELREQEKVAVSTAAQQRANEADRLREQLRLAAVTAAIEVVETRRAEARRYDPYSRTASTPFTPAGPAPAPQPFGVSDEGAEALVAEWMRFLGEDDATVTRYSGDGGIDVQSTHFVAQVKNYSGTVGVASVRELAGVAAVDGRSALFFTSGQYARGAVEFAQSARIALFLYSAIDGTIAASNALAQQALEQGLS